MPTNIFFYLVQTNFIDLIIVVFLYIFLLSNTTISKKMNRVFLITAVIINILIFADSTDFYLGQRCIVFGILHRQQGIPSDRYRL